MVLGEFSFSCRFTSLPMAMTAPREVQRASERKNAAHAFPTNKISQDCIVPAHKKPDNTPKSAATYIVHYTRTKIRQHSYCNDPPHPDNKSLLVASSDGRGLLRLRQSRRFVVRVLLPTARTADAAESGVVSKAKGVGRPRGLLEGLLDSLGGAVAEADLQIVAHGLESSAVRGGGMTMGEEGEGRQRESRSRRLIGCVRGKGCAVSGITRRLDQG